MINKSLKNEKGRYIYFKNDEGLFVCPRCDVSYKNQSSMNMHYNTHNENPTHVCKACKKGFLQKQTLDLHIKSRHPELLDNDENTKYDCPFDNCDFTAITKGNCIIHCLRVHFKDEINKIMMKDENNKTINCNECETEFKSSCAFYYHAKKCLHLSDSDEKHQKLLDLTN